MSLPAIEVFDDAELAAAREDGAPSKRTRAALAGPSPRSGPPTISSPRDSTRASRQASANAK